LLTGLNLIKFTSGSVLEVPLIELEEGHHLAEVKLLVEIVIEGRAEVVNWVAAQVCSVPLAVVDNVGNSVEVIPLEAQLEEVAEEARINRGEGLTVV